MSENWPPEWGNPDAEDQDRQDPGRDDPSLDNLSRDDQDRLAEVTAALASVPLPALPDAFKARISAAIAAEAAARAGQAGAIDVSATARSSSPDGFSPAAAGDRTTTAPPASSSRRRGFRVVQAIGSLAACLVIAGFGYLILRHGTTPSSVSNAAAPAASSFHAASGSAGSAIAPLQQQGSGAEKSHAGQSPGFVVRETGTRYEPATLAGQARAAIASSAASIPSPSGAGFPPSAALAGCVKRLAGGQSPTLVDHATYAGRPAYIIVVPRRAWVVGLGCTAARPELIRSVALAG